MAANPNLIYDLGMHHAKDTEFYLSKGFKVVALEANPVMANAARQKLADQVAMGQLVIVNKALWDNNGETISFYINSVKDDWSSVKKGWAEKGGHESKEISVQSITTSALFDLYGLPHYIKCDIEGADELFVQQLIEDGRLPNHVSVEAISVDLLRNLSVAGYKTFQIVNQALSWSVRPPNPPLEGAYVDVRFNGHMSGLFGRELDPHKWLDQSEAEARYLAFKALRAKDQMLAHGWIDFHATRTAHLTA